MMGVSVIIFFIYCLNMSINRETFPSVYNYRVKNQPTIDVITKIKTRKNMRTIIVVARERHGTNSGTSINMKDHFNHKKTYS